MRTDRNEPADSHDPSDPLGLEGVDREIRINELKQQVEHLGMSAGSVSSDCPPEVEEQFLRHIVEYESAPMSTHLGRLTAGGMDLPRPEALDDAALHAKLWEVINALAEVSTYLHSTDHLSDRELYAHLWHDSLRESSPSLPRNSGWRSHIDLIGSGSDEDITIMLRYYYDDEDRMRWARDFPDDPMPAKEPRPFDRDRLLPKEPPCPHVEIDYDELGNIEESDGEGRDADDEEVDRR